MKHSLKLRFPDKFCEVGRQYWEKSEAVVTQAFCEKIFLNIHIADIILMNCDNDYFTVYLCSLN